MSEPSLTPESLHETLDAEGTPARRIWHGMADLFLTPEGRLVCPNGKPFFCYSAEEVERYGAISMGLTVMRRCGCRTDDGRPTKLCREHEKGA